MEKYKKGFFIGIVIALMAFAFCLSAGSVLRKMYPQDYIEYVTKYAKEYNLDENLIFAIIKNESNFNKEIASNKGAIGLMQIMQETGDEVATRLDMQKVDLLDADINILIGTKYFSELYKKYNNVELALAAYNAGSGNVDKWIEEGIVKASGEDIENIPYKETNMYVRKVMQTKLIYDDLYK